MSMIFVGAKNASLGPVPVVGGEVPTDFAHSYLVYENDTGQRFVTSLTGTDDESIKHPFGRFDVTQIDTPYNQAEETSAAVRVEVPLDLGGRNADDVWSIITQQAEAIKHEAPVYDPLEQNSNSFVASLLNVVGIDYKDVLPPFDGTHQTSGEHGPARAYPGIANDLDFNYVLDGTGDADHLRGAGGADTLSGEGGNDLVEGGRGNDILHGGAGDDGLFGGKGNDILDGGAGNDLLNGASGKNTFVLSQQNDGATDRIQDFTHVDRVDLSQLVGLHSLAEVTGLMTDTGGHVTLDLSSVNAGTVIFENVANITAFKSANFDFAPDAVAMATKTGTNGDDKMHGTEGSDTMYALGGNDYVYADVIHVDSLGGDDTVYAGPGNDHVFAYAGDNKVYGEDGNDVLVTADDKDFIDGGLGNDDIQSGRGDDQVLGGDGNDALRGGEGDDLLRGGNGDDRVIGGSDDDHLFGESGNDRLEGRDGNDVLDGGAGNDLLICKSGNDSLVITHENAGATDTIQGFTHHDRLDLQDLVAIHSLADVTKHMTEANGDVTLSLAQAGGGSVVFENVADIGYFKAADFRFAPGAVASRCTSAAAAAARRRAEHRRSGRSPERGGPPDGIAKTRGAVQARPEPLRAAATPSAPRGACAPRRSRHR